MKCYYSIIPSWNKQNGWLGIPNCQQFVEFPLHEGERMKLSNSYNLKVIRPELAKQWHPTKNHDLTPDKVTPCSVQKVWWMCQEGHEWETFISYRYNGSGCPYCNDKIVSKENNLSTVNPELAKQWHPVKNADLIPDKVAPNSNKKVWWICDKGHEWQTIVKSRSKLGGGCPYCAGQKK